MGIKKIKIINFKSFENLEIELGNLNVLIGANASGKSNFVHVFEFLRDIVNSGLENAISMQGGVEYLRNINIGTSKNLSLKIVSNEEFMWLGKRSKEGFILIKTYEIIYEFALKFNKRGAGFKIVKDRLVQQSEFFRLTKNQKKKEILGKGTIVIYRNNGKVKIDLDIPDKVSLKKEDIIPPFLREHKLQNHELILETPYFLPPLEKIFSDISIYDFDPKLSKKATPITGKAELEENGNNLSIILKNIIGDKEKKRKLFNLIKNLLPFIKNLDVEKFADKSLLFKLQETYFENQYLPASLISDGTINITGLIVVLYFEKKNLVIIEEPERNIHPYLISKVVEMMKDAAQQKQLIVTTHNPEIVKYADLENILLVYRDKMGFSKISRPVDKEEIKTFLKNDIGIEELYVQNLLEM